MDCLARTSKSREGRQSRGGRQVLKRNESVQSRIVSAFAITLLTSIALFAPSRASSPPRGMTQLEVLKRFDPAILAHLARAPQPDANGAIGNNKPTYIQAGLQNESAWIVPDALVRKDTSELDKALRIIEYTFKHENPDGSFEFHVGTSGTADTALSRAGEVAFFYADLGQTLSLVRESSWFQHGSQTAALRRRVDALRPSAQRGLDWLITQAPVLATDQAAVNRTLNYGLAYYLVGKSLGRRGAMAVGVSFLKDALNRQQADGTFPEAGAFDSSYQGVSLYLAQIFYLELQPAQVALRRRLWRAIGTGVVRENAAIGIAGGVSTAGNTRIASNGERLFGEVKRIDGRSLTLALLYYAHLTGNKQAQSRADAIARRFSMTAL